ncbi:MAG: hypothetical protein V4819_05440 [Verrucomicrobiota bacterium]
MKNQILSSGLAVIAFHYFAGTCLALTPVRESFNVALNPARWIVGGSPYAKLQQGSGRLNFTVGPTSTEEDYASAELYGNQPGYNESWQVIVDVSNTANAGDDVGAGLYIYNPSSYTNILYFEFYGDGKGRQGGFQVSILKDAFGNYLEPHLINNPRVKKGSLRITFNKTTKLITFFCDKTGSADGYQWKKVGTFSPTGVGGDRRLNWNMNPTTGRFGIGLEAFGDNRLVRNGRVNMDNFILKASK